MLPSGLVLRPSLIFQVSGVILLLGSNLHFWYKARRVCSGVKRYCVYVAGAVLGTTCEELKRVPEEEFEKRWKELPLPQWIYNTWRWSFIGSLLTLTGVVLTSFGL